MKDISSVAGACLCGSVKIQVESMSLHLGACHCGTCRKWGGGPYLSTDCGTAVTIEGQSVTVYDSSDWAERGFCNQCGTHLFYRLKKNQQYMMAAGLFAVDEFTFHHQVFVDQRPSYYEFANETKNFTAAEIFAMFAKDS